MSTGDERELLKARAQALAGEPQAAVAKESLLRIVEFDLAGERYGFELAHVREVCLLKDLTPVPCTPPFVLGIINLRGEIRTVIDIKKLFELPEKGITDLNKIILLHGEDMHLGVLADVIRGVRTVAVADLQPTLPTLTGIRARYLRGVTSDRLIVLDALRILADDNLLVQDPEWTANS